MTEFALPSADLLLWVVAAMVVAGLISNLTSPVMSRIARALLLLDDPVGRKTHRRPVPRLGGIAILLGIGGGLALSAGGREHVGFEDLPSLPLLMVATGLVALAGVVDDLINLSALKKLAIEFVAAILVVRSGLDFSLLGIPGGEIDLGLMGPVVTVLWIVGVTNAINLIDGLDGLAAGIVAIISASFLVLALAHGKPGAALVAATMVGSCLGFLPHNWEPARIFMGDSGALTMGFLLAVLSVSSTLKSPTAVAILVPVLALGIPVFDSVLVALNRFGRPAERLSSRVSRVLRGDRTHLHHRLEPMASTPRSAVILIYAMVAVSCAMAAAVALTRQNGFGLVLLAVEIAAIFAVRWLGARASR